MKMDIERPRGVELRVMRRPEYERRPSGSKYRGLRYAAWTALGVASAYFVSTLSVLGLCVLGGVIVSVLLFLTAVCVSALNNTRF